MRKIYYGQIIKFEDPPGINIIEVVCFGREQFEPHKSFYVEPKIIASRLAMNYYHHTFKSSRMVVNYIRRELNHEQVGLKRFREFNFVEMEKNVIVNYEIYDLQHPFTLEEYYDGNFLYLIFKNLKVKITVTVDGLTQKLQNNVFRCHFFSDNKDIIIKGDNFMIHHKSSAASKNEMDGITITTDANHFIVTVSLELIRCPERKELYEIPGFSRQRKWDVQNESSGNPFDIEKQVERFNISGLESTNQNTEIIDKTGKPIIQKEGSCYEIEDGVIKINEEMFKDNYCVTKDGLIVKILTSDIEKGFFKLNIGKIALELKQRALVVNGKRIELIKAHEMYMNIEKQNE